jgi:hypothetical protein
MRLKVNGEWFSVEVGDPYQSPVEVSVDGETYMVEMGVADNGSMPTVRRKRPR